MASLKGRIKKMSIPLFKTKTNRLTDYALSCGYIERLEKNEVSITLWKEGCFHVRKHDYNKGRIFWESFDSLPKARKFYDNNLPI